MEIDGRTLDHKTLEHLRITACKFTPTSKAVSRRDPVHIHDELVIRSAAQIQYSGLKCNDVAHHIKGL